MEKIEAMYKGQLVYVHYVSKFMEYTLVSYTKDEEKKFKTSTADLSGINEKILMSMLTKQELEEQNRKYY